MMCQNCLFGHAARCTTAGCRCICNEPGFQHANTSKQPATALDPLESEASLPVERVANNTRTATNVRSTQTYR